MSVVIVTVEPLYADRSDAVDLRHRLGGIDPFDVQVAGRHLLRAEEPADLAGSRSVASRLALRCGSLGGLVR
jgi:hypothetical protein